MALMTELRRCGWLSKLFVLTDRTLAAITLPYMSPEKKKSLPGGIYLFMEARSLLGWTCFGYIWFCVWRTRAFIRERYRIHPSCCNPGCGPLEDACCAFWFSSCVVAQMSRHTADYHTYQASCCSGLPPGHLLLLCEWNCDNSSNHRK
jgi:hypothetical protein